MWTISLSCYSAERLFPGIRLANCGTASKPHSKISPPRTQKILKPISLTTARKPAPVQEHKSYSQALWDDSEFLMRNPLTLVDANGKRTVVWRPNTGCPPL